LDLPKSNLFYHGRFRIVDVVPNGANGSILLKILGFWGRMWEIWIFIDYNGLEDKLHYCNKSCAIFMIVCFHLLCLAPGLFLAGNAKFRSVFFSSEYRFLFETLGAWISPLLLSLNALYTAFWEKNNVDYFFLSLELNKVQAKPTDVKELKGSRRIIYAFLFSF